MHLSMHTRETTEGAVTAQLLLPCCRCKTATFANDPNNWCLLHASSALPGKQGTYCYSTASKQAGSIYPTKPVFP
jgi:hypothetical protein